MVSVSYILIAPEGFHLPEAYRWIGYAVAAAVTIGLLVTFAMWAKRFTRKYDASTALR